MLTPYRLDAKTRKAAKAAEKADDVARVVDKVKDADKTADKIKNFDVPSYVEDTILQIEKNKGNPPHGYKGGKGYKNQPFDGGEFLPGNTTYREYDVHPYQKGVPRGQERIVIGEDGSIWFTQDHYQTFKRIK